MRVQEILRRAAAAQAAGTIFTIETFTWVLGGATHKLRFRLLRK